MSPKAKEDLNKAARKAPKKLVVKKLTAAEKAAQNRTIEALMNLDLRSPAPKPVVVPPAEYELLDAAQNGDSERSCQLVEAGADVNAKRGNGWTPLQYAADHGDVKLVTLLLDKGAEINHRNIPTSRAAIHYAVMQEDEATLRVLIERGADIEVRNGDGDTPFLEAVSAGKEACVKLLIDSGCDVGAKNLAGKGMMYAAAKGQHGDLAELLMTYPVQSAARRGALEAQQKASQEALEAAQTVLQERVAVSRPLVLKSPLK